MAFLANKSFRRSKAVLCLVAIVMLQLVVSTQPGGFSAAQSNSRKKQTAAQPKKTTAAPKPSPTPTLLERLGEPPPLPVLPPKKEEQINPGDVISVETTEVMLPVTVRDANGRLVTALSRDDFRVFEDEREQPLRDLR